MWGEAIFNLELSITEEEQQGNLGGDLKRIVIQYLGGLGLIRVRLEFREKECVTFQFFDLILTRLDNVEDGIDEAHVVRVARNGLTGGFQERYRSAEHLGQVLKVFIPTRDPMLEDTEDADLDGAEFFFFERFLRLFFRDAQGCVHNTIVLELLNQESQQVSR